MKTLFITIFEGSEAKNIMRTPILSSLLEKGGDIRIVCFTKSRGKAEFYKKEFSDPRLFYEVVPRPSVKGIDAFFASLKFQLLRTKTTNVRRRMVLQKEKNYIACIAGHIFNWAVARNTCVKLARFFDYFLVKNDIYSEYFEKYRPDAVLCAHLFDEPEVHFLREAKRRGVASIGFINSWDKVTARCILRLLPDTLIVFNDIVKKELTRHNAVPKERIFVSGIPQYDRYVNTDLSPREEFFKKIGINPSKKLIVYAPMGKAFSNSDWDMIDMLYALRDKGELGDTDILVRFQPNDFIEDEELQKRPFLRYDYPGIRFSAQRGVDWDMSFDDLAHLTNTLYYMDLLVCYASSMSVDAAFFDKPVINIDFEVKKQAYLSESPTQFYRMTHYNNALRTGGIRLVQSKEELIEWARRYLANPEIDREKRKVLTEEQCGFTDGKSGKRLAHIILQSIRQAAGSK